MADRKSSLLSRFWPPSSTRRTSTTAPPPATTTTLPRAETKAPARQSTTKAATTSPPAPTTPPRTQPRKADQPSGEVQKASSQQTTTPSTTESKDKSKASSSSLPSTQSRSSPQSRSPPPQPSSPPPKRAPKPPSPSRLTSGSPKQRPSSSPKAKLPASSPSKPTETFSATHEAPTSPSKERDPEIKEEIKPDSTTTPAIIESLDSSSINGGNEADAKPEIVQETNAEANEETKKEVIDSNEAQIVEKAENPTKEILAAPSADAAASQPTERSSNLRVRDKSAPANEEQVQLNNQMAQGDSKKAISSDKPVNVIMLAGENRGASMQMESKSSKREEPVHIHRSYKTNPDEIPEAATTDAEEISEGEERSMEDQVMEAYVNNNAQGINNSIMLNSSIVEGNPGVHMVVNHHPKERLQSKDAMSGTETRRAEVNMSRAEKLTYQPTVKRRCLRGLLLETSDSDSEKPRRHGCRVGCQKTDRENNIDVS